MGMISEFKEFIAKGNVMDLAVGVIIGAAFSAIVNSLVADVITPALLNPALKAAQVENLAELKTDGGILYGKFLAAVISFLVIAFVIFLIVKAINSMKKKEVPAPAAPAGPTQEELLMQIRDLLKK
ncbi:large conductance mechanosensitive channel protein MscL [Flavobacterium sp. K77]|uniref:Large-conductance mechanosensitive channel n=1 Tax=Flavobacterium turcicum TaxID=2764718 RepID=A0ABR7JHT3_9FLAO|nr:MULTISPECIES: large conductance mechanosensitive channel protein MscL [Flavobacterium]MBC5863875.1 large conductance mechanosensitive channel protein MscL [Flavobacterium turcicum]MCF6141842.1 large conductance mechanosensitive channel protein MscL [Flavobacterium sp. K77]NHL02177.1 large conductance mechanosensitive channel protein MscL [Flavobacterium turcicum]